MQDNTFLKLALIWSLVGLFLLMVIATFSEPKTITISEMEQNIGKSIVISGIVGSASYKNSASFITLTDETGNTTIVLFDNPTNKTSTGNKIAAMGRIQVY